MKKRNWIDSELDGLGFWGERTTARARERKTEKILLNLNFTDFDNFENIYIITLRSYHCSGSRSSCRPIFPSPLSEIVPLCYVNCKRKCFTRLNIFRMVKIMQKAGSNFEITLYCCLYIGEIALAMSNRFHLENATSEFLLRMANENILTPHSRSFEAFLLFCSNLKFHVHGESSTRSKKKFIATWAYEMNFRFYCYVAEILFRDFWMNCTMDCMFSTGGNRWKTCFRCEWTSRRRVNCPRLPNLETTNDITFHWSKAAGTQKQFQFNRNCITI